MRKSTVAALALIVLGMGGLLLLADFYLAPIKDDAEVGQRLTAYFAARGDIAEGSRVKVLRVRAREGRSGLGLKVEVTPSEAARRRPGGARALARLLAERGREAYPPSGPAAVAWLELRFLAGGTPLATTVVPWTEGGPGEPEPPLPVTLDPLPPPSTG